MKTLHQITILDSKGRPQQLTVAVTQPKGLLDAVKAVQEQLGVTSDPSNTNTLPFKIDLEVE
jgi:hypothetical protein